MTWWQWALAIYAVGFFGTAFWIGYAERDTIGGGLEGSIPRLVGTLAIWPIIAAVALGDTLGAYRTK
ncbi:MAG: hypothetical protein Q7T61_01030 [Caulobacter sp.]|nr:hypothetical protein [Caulobacter sp.]